jgi:methylated-DNA-protein-cysteine methyltransferase related protein
VEELFDLVRRIPPGRCAAYGTLASCLSRRVSGLVVGRWMSRAPEDVPWWRVVAKDGRLPIWKVSPYAAAEQRERLKQEGVTLDDKDRVEAGFLLAETEVLVLD